MNEIELLIRLRDEVPRGEVPARAAQMFSAGIAGGHAGRPDSARRTWVPRPARWTGPGWRLVAADAIAAMLAATAAVVVVASPSAVAPSRPISVAELAYRAAVAAARQPDVRPGQWVYRRLYARPGTPFLPRGITPQWATADNTRNAFFYRGRLIVGPWSSWAPVACVARTKGGVGHPVPCLPGHQHVLKFPVGQQFVSYADLGSLPASPRALIRVLASKNPHGYVWDTGRAPGGELVLGLTKIGHARATPGVAARPGHRSASFRAFNVISYLLSTYVMRPQLTAELYRALGDITGIEVYDHAVDVAGRHGIGFYLRSGSHPPFAEMIILNPRTYQFMAFGDQKFGVAVLSQALVSGPGKLPRP